MVALTIKQIDELEALAINGRNPAAVKKLAAAAREAAADEPIYRVVTREGDIRLLTAKQYLSLTMTDLAGDSVTLIER